MTDLIPKHGGYRKLKSFQVAQLVYDVTVRFCERYIDTFSRTKDQMVQAARSGVQNIAEGSQASATSKKNILFDQGHKRNGRLKNERKQKLIYSGAWSQTKLLVKI